MKDYLAKSRQGQFLVIGTVFFLFGFILMIVLRSRKFNKVGFLTGFYFVWYGFERFFVEGLRTDSLMFLGFKIAQIVSILMVLVGIVIFVYSFRDVFWCHRI